MSPRLYTGGQIPGTLPSPFSTDGQPTTLSTFVSNLACPPGQQWNVQTFGLNATITGQTLDSQQQPTLEFVVNVKMSGFVICTIEPTYVQTSGTMIPGENYDFQGTLEGVTSPSSPIAVISGDSFTLDIVGTSNYAFQFGTYGGGLTLFGNRQRR